MTQRFGGITHALHVGYRLSHYSDLDLTLHGPSFSWNMDFNIPLKKGENEFRDLPLIVGFTANTAGEYHSDGGMFNWGTGIRVGVGTGSFLTNDGPWHAWKVMPTVGVRFNSSDDIPIYPSFGLEGGYNWGEDDFSFGGVYLAGEANYVPDHGMAWGLMVGWRARL